MLLEHAIYFCISEFATSATALIEYREFQIFSTAKKYLQVIELKEKNRDEIIRLINRGLAGDYSKRIASAIQNR